MFNRGLDYCSLLIILLYCLMLFNLLNLNDASVKWAAMNVLCQGIGRNKLVFHCKNRQVEYFWWFWWYLTVFVVKLLH